MANRSYLFASPFVPGADPEKDDPRQVKGISERSYAIPLVYRLLVSADVRLCRSMIWNLPEPTALAGRAGAVEHGRELRPSDAGHHAGRAHRARPDADLDDVGPSRDELSRAVLGHHVAGHHGDLRLQRAHGVQGVDHALLVSVRGVDDQYVDARFEQVGGLLAERRIAHVEDLGALQHEVAAAVGVVAQEVE